MAPRPPPDQPVPPVPSRLLLGIHSEIPFPHAPDDPTEAQSVELTKDWLKGVFQKLREKGWPYPQARAGLIRALAFHRTLVEHGRELADMGAIEVRGVGRSSRIHWHDNLTAIFAQSPLDEDGNLPWEDVVRVWNKLKEPVLVKL